MAIVAPIGLGFALRYKINPVLMGLMVVNGATAGGFSPISIFGWITNGVVEQQQPRRQPDLLFFSSLIFNALLSVVVFFMFGGRDLMQPARRHRSRRHRALQARDDREGSAGDRRRRRRHDRRRDPLNRDRMLTLAGIAALVVIASRSTGTSASSPSTSPSCSRC